MGYENEICCKVLALVPSWKLHTYSNMQNLKKDDYLNITNCVISQSAINDTFLSLSKCQNPNNSIVFYLLYNHNIYKSSDNWFLSSLCKVNKLLFTLGAKILIIFSQLLNKNHFLLFTWNQIHFLSCNNVWISMRYDILIRRIYVRLSAYFCIE